MYLQYLNGWIQLLHIFYTEVNRIIYFSVSGADLALETP